MKESIVFDKSKSFALRIIALYKYLCDEKKEFILSKQLLKQSHSLSTNGIKPPSMWNTKKNVTGSGIFLMNTLQRSILPLIPVSVF